MRFLVSYILSSIFFIASVSGNDGSVVQKQQLSGVEGYLFTHTTIDYSFNDNHSKAVVPHNSYTRSTNHYRFHPSVNFANDVLQKSRINIANKADYFVDPHLYCKRFGLKLIFPEHYFW